MKKLAVAFAVTMLVASIVAAYLRMELRSEREGLAGLRVRVSELESAGKVSAAAAATTHAAPDIAAPPVAASLPYGPEQLQRGGRPTTAAEAYEQGRAAALATMGAESQKLLLVNSYPDLARELGLSPADADRFLDLLARQGEQKFLVFSKTLEGKTPEEVRRSVYERTRNEELEQAAMLGSKYPQWRIYTGKVAARRDIDQLRTLLGAGENALTEAQAASLEAAAGPEIAQLTREQQDSAMSAPLVTPAGSAETTLRNIAERNRRVISAASSHLTASQLDRFREMLEKKLDSVRVAEARDERMRKIQAQLEAGQ